MAFLTGKKVLITGLASKRSIAYGIAKAMKEQGAELAFTYFNDKLKERVETIAREFDSTVVLELDVASDESIANCFHNLKKQWQTFDILVHAIAFAPADQLYGNYTQNATREGYHIAHDISAYSFVALAQVAKPMLNNNGALLTLSYLGAERSVPNYNVMCLAKASLEAATRVMAVDLGADGIRVNAISAGPIHTLAASGIKDFKKMLHNFEKNAPLKKLITLEDVGNTAAFLCSDLASGITGEIVHVDGGFSTVAMGELNN